MPCIPGVFRRLDVRREIVDEQAARRREVKFIEQRLIDSGLGLEQVNVRRDQRAGKALAARNVVPVGVLAAGGVGEQIKRIAPCLQLAHHVRRARDGHDRLVPMVDDVLRRGVQLRGEPGAGVGIDLLLGDGAAVEPHPVDRAQQVLPEERFALRADVQAAGKQLRAEVQQHAAHIKNNGIDLHYSFSPGSSGTAAATAASSASAATAAGSFLNSPVSFATRLRRRSLASSRSPRSRAPTP